MRVSVFVTCLVDQLFPRVGVCTVQILERFGLEVEFDPAQTCCGQPAFNSGYAAEARRVASHYLRVFQGVDCIVIPSGSCATMTKVFLPELFPEQSPERKLAHDLARRTYELSDFLVSRMGIEEVGASLHARAVFHDSCHQLRELGIREQPRRLLKKVRGLDLVEMPDSDRCCGFGGTFSVKFDHVSAELGHDKVSSILESEADVVVSNDVSCLMHLRGLLSRKQVPVKAMHLAEVLAASS